MKTMNEVLDDIGDELNNETRPNGLWIKCELERKGYVIISKADEKRQKHESEIKVKLANALSDLINNCVSHNRAEESFDLAMAVERSFKVLANAQFEEKILHASVRADNGNIFIGKSHAECFLTMRNMNLPMPKSSSSQGFMTNFGNFVDRKIGAVIAFDAGQIEKQSDILISEMLWHHNDNGRFSYDTVKGYHVEGDSDAKPQ